MWNRLLQEELTGVMLAEECHPAARRAAGITDDDIERMRERIMNALHGE